MVQLWVFALTPDLGKQMYNDTRVVGILVAAEQRINGRVDYYYRSHPICSRIVGFCWICGSVTYSSLNGENVAERLGA